MAKSIHDGVVVPYIAAERAVWTVLEEKLQAETSEACHKIVEAIAPKLVERAERCYAENKTWQKQFDSAKDQRYFLEMFMEHWTYGLLKNHLADLRNKGQKL